MTDRIVNSHDLAIDTNRAWNPNVCRPNARVTRSAMLVLPFAGRAEEE